MKPSDFGLGKRSLSRPAMAVAVLFMAMAVMAGCGQPVFVGLPTPSPDRIVVVPEGEAPVPRFGPHPYTPNIPVPGAPPAIETVEPLPSRGPAFVWSETENYLILGTDRRPYDDSWRTDTIMVVGIDRERQRAAVLSIPRDLYLEIPNYGYGRINQVDYIGERITKVDGGGPALVSTVLSQTLGIQTSHWVRFEMMGFKEIVDAVGGVDIHLDCPFYEPIYNLDTDAWEYFTLPAGPVHLDGEAAYWFVRLRLRESDIGRSERQRQFLWALRERVLTTNLLPRVPGLWQAFRGSFSTDLTLLQILDLLRFGVGLDPADVRASGITLRELQSYTTERGASVLVISDPSRVQDVVEGIWEAPAMAEAYRKDRDRCQPLPSGVPSVASDTLVPTPTPTPGGAPAQLPAEPTAPEPAAPDQGEAVAPEVGAAADGG